MNLKKSYISSGFVANENISTTQIAPMHKHSQPSEERGSLFELPFQRFLPVSFLDYSEVHGEFFLVFLESLGWVPVPDSGPRLIETPTATEITPPSSNIQIKN